MSRPPFESSRNHSASDRIRESENTGIRPQSPLSLARINLGHQMTQRHLAEERFLRSGDIRNLNEIRDRFNENNRIIHNIARNTNRSLIQQYQVAFQAFDTIRENRSSSNTPENRQRFLEAFRNVENVGDVILKNNAAEKQFLESGSMTSLRERRDRFILNNRIIHNIGENANRRLYQQYQVAHQAFDTARENRSNSDTQENRQRFLEALRNVENVGDALLENNAAEEQFLRSGDITHLNNRRDRFNENIAIIHAISRIIDRELSQPFQVAHQAFDTARENRSNSDTQENRQRFLEALRNMENAGDALLENNAAEEQFLRSGDLRYLNDRRNRLNTNLEAMRRISIASQHIGRFNETLRDYDEAYRDDRGNSILRSREVYLSALTDLEDVLQIIHQDRPPAYSR
jgi:hypothetical protein